MEQKPAKKMFLQIVKQLRDIIAQDNIQPGDKLPSERVLSEKLQVGRSSVREALRSLELLGLIETKHGGGTYLGSVQQHQLVEIVGSFILQEPKSANDVHATREMHEREAIQLISSTADLRMLPIWDSFFERLELEETIERETILQECMILSGNRLALKIWRQLVAYSTVPLAENVEVREKKLLQTMLKAMQLGYDVEAIEAYEKWMKLLR